MNNRIRWRLGALASAVALLGSLASLDAHALALGRITVQSALGEPLRAEVDIAEISSEEAASLKASVGTAEAFKAAGLEYTAAVVGVQVTLQKRADGRSFLRLTSSRPVSEPFVDLVLEANWSSGKVVRDYTMLFDPPSLRQSGVTTAPVAPTAPVFSRPLPVSPPPAMPSAAGIGNIPYSPPPRTVRAPAAPAVAPAARASSGGQQVSVKSGDTAGRIAAQNKPASVSLDQMLVAMLRNNPDAFIGGNINRIKSGAVLEIPGAEEASAISSAEASRTIFAQSKDFNEFRRKLAEGVAPTQMASANRQAGGKVEARVEDRAPATTTPDKLTLSKGAVQGKSNAAAEEKIAKDRQAKAASDRVAELSKNIGDLNKLTGGPAGTASAAKSPGVAVTTPAVLGATPAPAAVTTKTATLATPTSMPAVTAPLNASVVPTPTTTVAAGTTALASTTAASAALASASSPATAASQAASAASATTAAVATASAPVVVPVKKPVAPPPPPPPEPSLVDELTNNPFILPGVGLLVLLLAGLGFYKYKKRAGAVSVDSSFLESRLQPDSFFGASGGQRIDTSEGGGATGSSLVYSPSQLDAAGDVDPVAEADVYLAYGRDLQAEEILKEALRTNPGRVAIHAKLMEIYAKRRDIKAFEVVAVEAFNLTKGDGPEWAYIGEMGRELDPANPMYQPGGQPKTGRDQIVPDREVAAGFGSSTIPQMIDALPEETAGPVDFDLDLDFSLGDEPAAVAPPPPAPAPAPKPPEPTIAMKAAQDPIFDGLEMDFSSNTVALKPTPAPAASAPAVAPSPNGMSFDLAPSAAVSPPPSPPAATLDSGMLEFDLGSLSLDLASPETESPEITAAAPMTESAEDPLETKFALAEEFRALGDMDGARSLAEEVASQAKGPLHGKAQAFLNALS